VTAGHEQFIDAPPSAGSIRIELPVDIPIGRRIGGYMGATDNSVRSRDLLALKHTVCQELARVTDTVGRLQHRQRHEIAPDLSTDDLLEIFHEEHARLFRQLQAIDESLLNLRGGPTQDVLEQNRQTEQWRNALQKSQTSTGNRSDPLRPVET
jgi:hypothetical protein